jgi:hypothetical protein
VDALAVDLRKIFAAFPVAQTPNEGQTEDDLIWPVLTQLGWSATLAARLGAEPHIPAAPEGPFKQRGPAISGARGSLSREGLIAALPIAPERCRMV